MLLNFLVTENTFRMTMKVEKTKSLLEATPVDMQSSVDLNPTH